MNIVELITRLGPEAVGYQWLNQPGGALNMISTDKLSGISTVQLQTKAITINSVAENRGPVGLILWCDREMLRIILEAKNGTP